jgi:hypothetical protein
VLAKVAHRHVVLTIPRLLRPLLRRRRELLTELGRAAAEAMNGLVGSSLGTDARPGLVVSIATAEDLLQWHPQLHVLTTDGGMTADGSWQLLPEWDGVRLMSLFRERLLARLVECHAISPELVAKLLAWRHLRLLRRRRRADRTRTEAAPRGHRRLPRPQSPLAQQARLPRWGEGRRLPLADESLPRPEHSRGGETASAGAGGPPRRRARRRLGRAGALGASLTR